MTMPSNDDVSPAVRDYTAQLSEVQFLRQQVQDLMRQIQNLTTQVIEMKREGFAHQPPAPTFDNSSDLPEEVLQAIEERSPSMNSAMARGLEQFARRAIRQRTAVGDVVREILQGQDLEAAQEPEGT